MEDKKSKVKSDKLKVTAKKAAAKTTTKKATSKAVDASTDKKVVAAKKETVSKTVAAKAEKKPAEKAVSEKIVQYAIGRRKRSVARVRMYTGDGEIIINGKSIEEFVPSEATLKTFLRPLEASGVRDGHRFTVKVLGGGISGQLGATLQGISRCIAKINDDLKNTMKQGGYLTRDPREKERKKVYHVRARKSPQYSKR